MTIITGKYPDLRLRRLRQNVWVRSLAAENTVTTSDLILPIFIRTEFDSPNIASLPGVKRHSLAELPAFVQKISDLGIASVMLFPATPSNLKCPNGLEALNANNLLCQAVRLIKSENPAIGIITDVALDPYTDHAHDGIIINGQVDNDATIKVLCDQALVQAQAGADAVAPSDMMDGRVGAIRKHLDHHGFHNILIISYAVKYASAFYGPFRQAIGVQKLGLLSDKRTYQMNPANANEAIREAALDVQEGADMLIVKPGMPYLDIIQKISDTFKMPTLAYQVSGEYAAIMAAHNNGWLDADQVMLESMVGFKRSGASAIITYYAERLAEILPSI